MELNKLGGFVVLVVMVAMIIGIGIITLDKFGSITYYDRVGVNETFTPINKTGVALNHGNLTLNSVKNASDSIVFPAACYTLYSVNGSFILQNQANETACAGISDGSPFDLVINYDYKEYQTAVRDAARSVSTEISNIATSWLGLIATIVVLAIILGLVMGAFGGAMGRSRQ